MGDIRCPKSIDIDLNESNGCVTHWFRSESELQNEGKGGFLVGKVRVKGVDTLKETIDKIVLTLVSSHSSEMHCNLLRIGLNSFHKTSQKCDGVMLPTTYSVILIRGADGIFKIDTTNHDYLPSELNDVGSWNESTQTLTLGEKGFHNNRLPNGSPVEKESGLCLNIVKPLSKQDQKNESTKKFCHIRQVLKQMKEDKIRKLLAEDRKFATKEQKDKELERLMTDFVRNELNEDSSNSKRKKQALKSLETILAEGEMHKAKLKVAVFISQKGVENNNNELKKVEEIENFSEWILASNRYGFKIDNSTTKSVILDNSSIWDLTIFLETCKITSKMQIEAQFLYGQKNSGDGTKEEIGPDEITILPINGNPVYRDKLGQVALQIFIKTKSGEKLNLVKNGISVGGQNIEFGLYLRLRVLDESGYGVVGDTIELNCLSHNCPYDAQLAIKDDEYQDIIKDEVIKRWSDDGKLSYLPCILCQIWGRQARTQYLQKMSSNTAGSKRRTSLCGKPTNSPKKCKSNRK